MTGPAPFCLHATCLQLSSGGRTLGILLRGKSGSGKSALALQLLDQPGSGLTQGNPPVTAQLVSDDQVVLSNAGGKLRATAPAAIAGLLEVRGLGILEVPGTAEEACIGLVIDHAPAASLARLPEPTFVELCGVPVAAWTIDFSLPDAAARIHLLARLVWGDIRMACESLPQDLAARR
jgi:serine kinase of HPr protein (carbohydrate metabolism regulator)